VYGHRHDALIRSKAQEVLKEWWKLFRFLFVQFEGASGKDIEWVAYDVHEEMCWQDAMRRSASRKWNAEFFAGLNELLVDMDAHPELYPIHT
jgi:hypothetical protein